MEEGTDIPRWRTLDLFCGAAGGWTLGLHRAGLITVAACEIDPWRRAAFSHNNPGIRLYDDIRTLGADRLRGDLGFLPEIICGSPPCQDASTANTKGRGVDGERTGLFFEALRLVREVRPRWVLLENVPGLRTRGYDRVQDALEQAGYAVWPLVVGAVHAGAPHLRKRVWIIALAKSAQEQMGRAGFTWEEAERIPADAEGLGRGQAIMAKGSGGSARQSQGFPADAASVHGAAVARREPDRDRAEAATDASQSDPIRRPSIGRRIGWPKTNARIGPLADADLPRCEPQSSSFREALGTAAREAAERNPLAAWDWWNGGAPDLGRVDDGLSEALASRRGIGRACLAAYGDAVIPEITEAIARTIRLLDRVEL